jgi:hypothetical protein
MPRAGTAERLSLLWQADDAETDWAVEYRCGVDPAWRPTPVPAPRRIAVPGVAPHRLYRAALTGLTPGGEFTYRVRKGGEIVFSAAGRARKAPDQPHRFVAFGDCAAGTDGQKAVAYRAYLARPDYVLIPGDIVYARGRITEYREKFWPVYNADEPSPPWGRLCSARPSSWPRRATTTSRRATWRSTPTAWPISSTGTSR